MGSWLIPRICLFMCGLINGTCAIPTPSLNIIRLREVARRMPCVLGEYAPSHPHFPPGSAAACTEFARDGKVVDLVYSREDDEAIENWVRATIGTCWHSMSTCPMRGRDIGGVVDDRLDVYGVKGLKIAGEQDQLARRDGILTKTVYADPSICPSNLGTNTSSVALIIGEKCASLVEEDLRERAM